MRVNRLLAQFVGILLVVSGSLVWLQVPTFQAESVFNNYLGSRLVQIDESSTTDLTQQCAVINEEGGWILFVLDANLRSDYLYRRYFETAPEPSGLWVEHDAGLLRVGLGLGPESSESSASLSARLVRTNESATIIIAVSRNETRVIADKSDARSEWPGKFSQKWQCNAVVVGDETPRFVEGDTCAGCSATLRYATGASLAELDEILSKVSNARQAWIRRITGTCVTLLGFPLLFVGRATYLRQFRKRQKFTDGPLGT